MKAMHLLVAGVAAGVALGLAGIADAQMYGGPGYGPGMMGQGGYGPGMMGPGLGPRAGAGAGPFAPAQAIDSRLAALKTDLGITAAQESAWQAFAAALRDEAQSMAASHATMQQPVATAPEWMALRATVMQQRADAMAAVRDAFDALYAVLTPEQRAIADRDFGPLGGWGPRFGPFPG